MKTEPITSTDDPALAVLCNQLADRADAVDASGEWPGRGLAMCGHRGVFRWFIDPAFGGLGWDNEQVVRGYLALSAACLTTTFVITQRTGACRRIADGQNDDLRNRLLPELATGGMFATVGVSHLTTSHRHLARPVLRAQRQADGWRLDGFAPWVTGGDHADLVVIGADVMHEDKPTGEQILLGVPTDLPGVSAPEPPQFVGVSASHTGRMVFDDVEVSDEWLIQGPVENVMLAGRASTPGGHETSTLAIGLASAAIGFLRDESEVRADLMPIRKALEGEHAEVLDDLLAIARGEPNCSPQELRQRANSLVLRAAQASLAAAKGTGYVTGHPTGRWCREALFFLVWSCPQPVMNANLCELAGIAD